jgi:carbon-monoxide dehydrogenase medium subunit/xanthine dehydrogenase FAD-binding subunit
MDARAERFEDVRLSVGGVGPVAQRMHEIEDALRGSLVSPQTLGKILPLADHTVQSRSRQDYRKKIVRAFIARALSRAMARAGVSAELCARCEEVCHD